MRLDLIIIIVYTAAIILIGLKFSKAGNIKDYFLGGRTISWPIACFSIVATETSTLTFISIPGLAYITNLGFLQIAAGYLIGRVVVAQVLLPKYFSGGIETTYEYLQDRFSISSRRIVAVIFHVTRLLADSIRLFATAIPLAMLLEKTVGFNDYRIAAILIGAATFIYTIYGGIRSVVVVDSIQLFLYLICAVLGIGLISNMMGKPVYEIIKMIPDEKLVLFSTGLGEGGGLLTSYNIFSGIIGGALLSFGSHGTDHLLVQRVLSCKDLKSAKKAMVVSGIVVIFQFVLFLMLGIFIMVFLNNRVFSRPDEILPYFIMNYLPHGFRGLMLAGIFAAAMSSLSSSINSLSSSTTIDIINIQDKNYSDKLKIKISRMISLLWTVIIVIISTLLSDNKSPLVELGLGIASLTYGGMIGIFLQARYFEDFSEKAAILGVILSIAGVIIVSKFFNIFWPWFVPIGLFISFFTGMVFDIVFKMKAKQRF
ncbi:sodium:solute symporter [Spirochaetota bacterium]